MHISFFLVVGVFALGAGTRTLVHNSVGEHVNTISTTTLFIIRRTKKEGLLPEDIGRRNSVAPFGMRWLVGIACVRSRRISPAPANASSSLLIARRRRRERQKYVFSSFAYFPISLFPSFSPVRMYGAGQQPNAGKREKRKGERGRGAIKSNHDPRSETKRVPKGSPYSFFLG